MNSSRTSATVALLALSLSLGCVYLGSTSRSHAASPAGQGTDHVSFPDLRHELAVEFLRLELSRSGADLEHQAIHLILGFSTGHYADDPRHAEAMVQVAKGILRDLIVPGDRVTSVGWEMDVWKESWAQPYRVGAESQIAEQWPQTPKEGSRGGHDYNRSLIHILRELKRTNPDARDYAVLFMCPHPYSQTEVGGSSGVVGEDNPELVQLRQEMDASEWKLREIPFTDNGKPRRVCLALVVPNSFQGRVQLVKTRTELLELKRGTPPPPDRNNGMDSGKLWWVLLIVPILAAACFLIWKVVRNGRRPLTLSVAIGKSAQQGFTGPWRAGEIIQTYVGPAARETSERQVRVQELSPVLGGPVLRLQAITSKEIRAEPLSGLKLYSAAGMEYPQGYLLKRGAKESLRLRGTVTSAGVPMSVDVPVELELK